MTFDKDYLARISTSGSERPPVWRSYVSSADTLATVIASGYFNDKINDWAVNDVIHIQASNGYGLYKVTSVTTNVTVEAYDIPEGNLDLTYGSIFVGDATGKATELVAKTDTQLLVGNGTTLASVAMSGDATLANTGALTIAAGAIDNGKVNAAAAIAWSKMAALTEGSLLLGNATNVATVTDFSTDTQIGVGNGTTFVSVAVSGDATLANTGALTIAAGAVDNGKLAANAVDNSKVDAAAAIAWSKMAALTEGNLLLGSAANVATVTDFSTDGQIGVGDGTTFNSVAVSGDATLANTGALTIAAGAIDNGKVNAAAAIAWSKMAALTEGNLLVGSAANVATVTDFSANAQIGIGDGTTFNSVAVSGDMTITNAGVVTIANDAITTVKILNSNVTEGKIAPNTLTGTVVGNTADAPVIGGIPVIFPIATAGGATANTDVTSTHKIRIVDVWVVNTGLGTAGDTIQIFNGASAITDAIDINKADETVTRAGTIDDVQAVIAAAGTLRVTETDGGGADSPSTIVYVLAIRSA